MTELDSLPCACCSPVLRKLSDRLSGLGRRHFLTATAATVATAGHSAPVLSQPSESTGKVVFRQARLFDGKSSSLRDNVQVIVDGAKITAIDTANNPAPAGATVIDCGGRVVMPGLIDAHWHALFAALPAAVLTTADPGYIFSAATAEAERTLQRGFTTVRDVGGPTFSFKQAIDDGLIPGPRIYPSGAMITSSGGHGDLRMLSELPRTSSQLSTVEKLGGAMIVDSVGEIQQRTREQLMQGASQIKVVAGGGVSSPRSPLDMTTFSEAELRAAVGVARDWNTYATMHAYASNTIQRAIAAGAACIEHAHLMDDETARLMADKQVWLSTQPFLSTEDAVPLTGPSRDRLLQVIAGTNSVYTLARKHGIKTAWGSDMLFSPAVTARQGVMLTHLARWYSNAEILKMATSTNAELLALSNLRNPYPGRLGVVEAGALADLLLIDGNPLEDIRLIENPAKSLRVIMKDGRIHKNTLRS